MRCDVGEPVGARGGEGIGWGLALALVEDSKTESRTAIITLARDKTIIVFRDVPTEVCTTCGEEYVDAATGKRLAQIAETAVKEGVQVDVRRYKVA